jgi:hypothetical protein
MQGRPKKALEKNKPCSIETLKTLLPSNCMALAMAIRQWLLNLFRMLSVAHKLELAFHHKKAPP